MCFLNHKYHKRGIYSRILLCNFVAELGKPQNEMLLLKVK